MQSFQNDISVVQFIFFSGHAKLFRVELESEPASKQDFKMQILTVDITLLNNLR